MSKKENFRIQKVTSSCNLNSTVHYIIQIRHFLFFWNNAVNQDFSINRIFLNPDLITTFENEKAARSGVEKLKIVRSNKIKSVKFLKAV